MNNMLDSHNNQIANVRDDLKGTNDNLQRTRTRLVVAHHLIDIIGIDESMEERLHSLELMVGEMQCMIQADYTEKIEKLEQLIKSNSNDFRLVRDVFQERITALEEAKKCSCKDSNVGALESKHVREMLKTISDIYHDWDVDEHDISCVAMHRIGEILKEND